MSKTYAIITSFLFALLLAPVSAIAADEKGSATGLPLPRFVSLKSDEVNLRTGPGTRYPIQWVYRRKAFPLEITEEFDLWRKIRDIDGASGWIHKSMLMGNRSAIIQGSGPQIVRANPDEDSRPLFKAEPRVLSRLIECEIYWCRLQIAGRKGWIEKKYLWGVYPGEIFD